MFAPSVFSTGVENTLDKADREMVAVLDELSNWKSDWAPLVCHTTSCMYLFLFLLPGFVFSSAGSLNALPLRTMTKDGHESEGVLGDGSRVPYYCAHLTKLERRGMRNLRKSIRILDGQAFRRYLRVGMRHYGIGNVHGAADPFLVF